MRHSAILGMAIAAAVAGPATAGTQYDRKLEQSAMAIVAANIGELRGSLPYDVRHNFVRREVPPPTTAREAAVVAGSGRTSY